MAIQGDIGASCQALKHKGVLILAAQNYDLRQKYKEIFESELRDLKPSSIPIDWYITFAVEAVVNGDIPSSCRTGRQQEHVPATFHVARFLMGHPELSNASAYEALAALTRCMEQMGWKWTFITSGDKDDDEAEIEFLDFWDKVRFPVGWEPLPYAERRAQQHPLRFIRPKNALQAHFLSIAAHLQLLRPEDNILLPCHRLAGILRRSHETIWRMRNLAKKEGYLREEKKARFLGFAGAGEATEFRFALERFDSQLREREQTPA